MEIPSLVIVNLSRVDLDAVRLEALDATGAALARAGENVAQDAATPAVTIPYVSRQGTRPSIPVRGAPFSGRTRHTLEFAASGRDSTVAAPGSTGDGSVLGFNATAHVPRAMFTAEGHASHDAEIHLEHTEHVRVRLLRTVSDQRTVFTLIDRVDLADWMASLSDAAPFTSLTIPGTHDTCARTEGGPVTICQSMTLAQQLEAGVRFIDIRCRHVDDRFQIYHGIISQDLEFGADVHDVCLEFLARHPRECIVMSIDEASTESDCTRTFEQTFRWYVEDDLASWSLGDTLPRLGDLRGKIVLFRRFERSSASQLGLAAEPWPDDATFTIEQPVQMRVQDQYCGAHGLQHQRQVE